MNAHDPSHACCSATGAPGPAGQGTVVDPVCGMQVDPAKAAAQSEYNGKTYYFCAAICKTKFDANPSQYVK